MVGHEAERLPNIRLTSDGPAKHARPAASRRSQHAFDWFVFFVADVQTGFGPFVAVYLTERKWTQTDIGLILTVSGLVGLIGQMPAGLLVDAVKSLRMAAMTAVALIAGSAFAMAAWPIFPIVLASRIVHAGASCVLGLAIAAMSLTLVGREGISWRLGRNASFASIGTGLAAAGMGACGYYLSNQAVFFVSAALGLPAIMALLLVPGRELDRSKPGTQPDGHDGPTNTTGSAFLPSLRALATDRPLVIFAGCVVLFHLANASMLPLAASMLTLRSSEAASVMVAAAMVVPQVIVAVLSPIVGAKAQSWGRKPLLIIGFAALPIRGILFAFVSDPRLLVAVQALDGVSAAVLGVLVPLTIADVTRKSGHFNLAQGAVGCAVGIGASISTTLVGFLSDRYGSDTAFMALALVAVVGCMTVFMVMPETRNVETRPDQPWKARAPGL